MNQNDLQKIKSAFCLREGSLSQRMWKTYFNWSWIKFILFVVLLVGVYTLCLIIEHIPMAAPVFALIVSIRGSEMLAEYIVKMGK